MPTGWVLKAEKENAAPAGGLNPGEERRRSLWE